jgi:hypothetical protein
VPFCPSAQPQGGLSLPPRAGAVSLGYCVMLGQREAIWPQALSTSFSTRSRTCRGKRPPTEAAYFIVNWKTDSPKRMLGACQNPVIDPVNAARFMTVASTLQRRARSAALNAPYAVQPSRIGTRLGFLDIDSLPVQLRCRMADRPKRHPGCQAAYILAFKVPPGCRTKSSKSC